MQQIEGPVPFKGQGQQTSALNVTDEFTCVSVCVCVCVCVCERERCIWCRDYKLFPHREFLKHKKSPSTSAFQFHDALTQVLAIYFFSLSTFYK